MSCTVCGLTAGNWFGLQLPLLYMWEALKPKPRTTLGGETDDLCLACQTWVAISMGLVKA